MVNKGLIKERLAMIKSFNEELKNLSNLEKKEFFK